MCSVPMAAAEIHWREADGTDPRLLALVLAGLFAAGASLTGVAELLLRAPAHGTGLVAVIATAYAAALALVVIRRPLPVTVLGCVLGVGSALIALAAWCSGDRPSPLVFLYLWIFVYSAYFLTPRHAGVQIVCASVTFAVLLAVAPPRGGDGLAWWTVAVAAMLGGVVVVAVVRRHSSGLVAQLRGIARTDALTGLVNRRGFYEHLEAELERARREGTAFAVVVGDIDHFKRVNDRLGHPVGDDVLRQVAAVMEQTRRRIDTAARVGGEELALLLPGVAAEGAVAFAERLRRAVRDAFGDAVLPITMSFGIASHPADGDSIATLLAVADRALYAAKQGGRDRSVHRTHPPVEPRRLSASTVVAGEALHARSASPSVLGDLVVHAPEASRI